MRVCSIILIWLVIFTTGSQAATTNSAEHPRVELDGITVNFSEGNGIAISVDGIPFSHAAQTSLTDPSWNTSYYNYTKDDGWLEQLYKQIAKQAGSDAQGIHLECVLKSRNSNGVALATQTVDILPERRLRFGLDVQPQTTLPLLLENRVASIGEAWLSNRPFRATLADGSTTSGRIFAWAPSSKPTDCMIADDFSTVTIESPFGPVSIHTSGTLKFSLFDYRKNEWAAGQRYFWMGALGTKVPQSGTQYEMTIHFPPARTKSSAQSMSSEAVRTLPNKLVYEPSSPQDVIIPSPKSVSWKDDNLAVGGKLPLTILPTDSASKLLAQDADSVIEYYANRWADRFGVKLLKSNNAAQTSVTIRYRDDWDLPTDKANEAYSIQVSKYEISIETRTATGLRNGLATLEQLFRRGADEQLVVRCVDITDFPSLPFRGIHFFTGRDGAQVQQKMIAEILAPLKINELVYQVDYLEWDTLPPPHHPRYSMKKSEAKQVADAARRAGIEVIPLLNTFGHNEWLVGRDALRYLADNPDQPYAYDPSNPEVYQLCERIYDEIIALFHPRVIHIGHDEVTMNGFPQKPANKAVGATQLLINDILHYHKYLADKGVGTMIWGDMFLAPGESPDACLAPTESEATRRRGLLPKDIIITDWHYKPAPPEDYKSLSIFNQAGFDAIACTWDHQSNITNFAKAALDARQESTASLGLLQTTWAGYSFDEQSLRANFNQYAAYVLAAEAAWTGGSASTADLDYQSEFLRRWTAQAGALHGWQGDLTALANMTLTNAQASQLGLAANAFAGLHAGENDMAGYRFQLATDEASGDSAPMAVLTSGALELHGLPPSNNVYLALASTQSWPVNMHFGNIILENSDGHSTKVELMYGQNVFSIHDGAQSFQSPLIWRSAAGQSGDGQAAIHLLELSTPDKAKIQRVRIELKDQMELMILGMLGDAATAD